MPDPFTDFGVSQHIIYEDNYLLVINKPAGLSTEGSLGLAGYVSRYLADTYPWKKQLITGVVHRLDRPVSGVIVFTKTKMALKTLNLQFAKRSVKKKYLAVCENDLPKQSGALHNRLLKDREARRAWVCEENHPEGKEARLRYQVLQSAGNHRLVEIELLTGRYHQIRVQLAAAGCPVIGDELYGGIPDADYPGGIYLHSHWLSLVHPKSGEEMPFTVPPAPVGKWRLFRLPR